MKLHSPFGSPLLVEGTVTSSYTCSSGERGDPFPPILFPGFMLVYLFIMPLRERKRLRFFSPISCYFLGIQTMDARYPSLHVIRKIRSLLALPFSSSFTREKCPISHVFYLHFFLQLCTFGALPFFLYYPDSFANDFIYLV